MKKKDKKLQTQIIVTVGLLLVLAFVGVLAFNKWLSGPAVTDTGNVNLITTTNQPASNINAEEEREALRTGEPDMLIIPERDISTPVIYITQAENTHEGQQDALSKGVVHYPGTAKPGQKGNPYIFGHSSDYFWKPGEYKEVFKNLVDIPIGTEIEITDSEGSLYIYKVIETKTVGPEETSVLDQQEYQRYLLTLQTSWPIGTALKRYLAIAEMDEAATFGEESN